MQCRPILHSVLALTIGAAAGAATVPFHASPVSAATPQAEASKSGAPATQADLARLRDLIPSQSHAMADVGYHFANLWFAAKARNWPLAEFCLDETRSHIRWAIHIRPVRKDPAGNTVDLQGIFDGIDDSLLGAIRQSIEKKNGTQFITAYRHTLQGCYACHRASGKPYLRPMIPTTPGSILNFDPAATWP